MYIYIRLQNQFLAHSGQQSPLEALMRLVDLITPHACILKLEATTKDAAIEEIGSRFTDDPKTNQEIITALKEREKQGSTVISGTIMALPHSRQTLFKDFYLGIGISPGGIPTLDSQGNPQKTKLFIIIASHPSKNQLMLNIMSIFAEKIKNDPQFIERLLTAPHKDGLLKTMEPLRISTKVTLEQIIQKDYPSISPNASLVSAVSLLSEKNLYFLPVLNEEQELIGEITSRDILLFAVPDYLISMDNFRFVVEDEPFERYFAQERDTPVKEVMNKNPFHMSTDISIIEGVSIMLKEKQRYLYVTSPKKKFVGVLTLKDVLKKILFA